MCLQNVKLAAHKWGLPDRSSGVAVVDYIKTAVDLCMRNEADAIVTAPINKEMMNAAGHHYAGHTELLAHLTNTKEFGMMFVGGGLKLILATIHVALKDVPRHITTPNVLRTLRLAHKAMQYFGMDKPRIGVAALNPHAGEGRLFGSEEWDEILPAIVKARAEGIHASDPIPDAVLVKEESLYIGLPRPVIPTLGFGHATVGPIIRTSITGPRTTSRASCRHREPA
jgi:4-hydroxythreonine-4-phosphate dehydrogenase